jgi:Anti-sigma factor NepR
MIGGKLRALYDDAAQPCPDRIAMLLAALKAGSFVSHQPE